MSNKEYSDFVAAIAIEHGCRLVAIAYPEKVITLSGPFESVRACAATLEGLRDHLKAA